MNNDSQVTPNVPEEPQVPQTPVTPEVPQTPTTPSAPETPQTPPVDVDKLRQEVESSVSEKVSTSIIGRIADALGLNKKEEAAIPTDPVELTKYIEAKTQEKIDQTFKAREDAERKQKQEYEAREAQQSEQFVKTWDRQYTELSEGGKVPKITNPNDANDPGRIAKTKILTQMYQMIQDNAAKGLDYVPTIKEVFYEHPDLFKEIPGATAPVSGGGRNGSSTVGMSYEEMHNTSIEDLAQKAYKK